MENWIILISFTYPHEAHLAKGRLESEGFEVMIKDELTVQVNSFYSNAIGGVKLLVKESDYENARQIFIESGYIKERIGEPNTFFDRFDKLTSKLPLIGKSMIELRLIIMVALTLLIIIIPIVLWSLPSTLEKLTMNSWCVDKIYYKGLELTPYTQGVRIVIQNQNCSEKMYFSENGEVVFPGINSPCESARWEFRNDSLFITAEPIDNATSKAGYAQMFETEKLLKKSIFHGAYRLKIKHNMITMESDSLTILGEIYNFNIRF